MSLSACLASYPVLNPTSNRSMVIAMSPQAFVPTYCSMYEFISLVFTSMYLQTEILSCKIYSNASDTHSYSYVNNLMIIYCRVWLLSTCAYVVQRKYFCRQDSVCGARNSQCNRSFMIAIVKAETIVHHIPHEVLFHFDRYMKRLTNTHLIAILMLVKSEAYPCS